MKSVEKRDGDLPLMSMLVGSQTEFMDPSIYAIKGQWPRVSVIIPSFNQGDYLEKTLLSVLAQNYPDLEIIVVDNQSSDSTHNVASRYKERISRYISQADRGIYEAMNTGLNVATGDFVYFIGIKDILWRGALFQLMKSVESGQQVVLYGDCYVRTDGALLLHKHPRNVTLNHLLCYTINHQSVMVSKSVFKTIGNFATHYRFAADWLFLIKAFVAGFSFKKIEYPVCIYDTTGRSAKEGVTRNEMNLIYNNELRHLKGDHLLARRLLVFQRSRWHRLLESVLSRLRSIVKN